MIDENQETEERTASSSRYATKRCVAFGEIMYAW